MINNEIMIAVNLCGTWTCNAIHYRYQTKIAGELLALTALYPEIKLPVPFKQRLVVSQGRTEHQKLGFAWNLTSPFVTQPINNTYADRATRLTLYMTGTCNKLASVGESRAGKHEGKRPLGRPWSRLEDNIKMDLQDVECGGID